MTPREAMESSGKSSGLSLGRLRSCPGRPLWLWLPALPEASVFTSVIMTRVDQRILSARTMHAIVQSNLLLPESITQETEQKLILEVLPKSSGISSLSFQTGVCAAGRQEEQRVRTRALQGPA